MEKRHSLPRKVGYAVVAFLLAGCLVSGAVTIVSEGRDSTFNPWVVGFGGTLLFVVSAGQTALAGQMVWRSWRLRLFGTDTWAVLTDKESRTDADDTTFWTAHMRGAGFTQVVDTGSRDPGPVGEPVLVRRHAPSNQVELLPAPAPAGTLIRDVFLPFGLILAAAFTAAIGYGLARGAIDLLR